MKPHKHAELIKAWADGATIQFKSLNGEWMDCPESIWGESCEYRIKPEPKQDWDEYLLFFREDDELIIRTYKHQAKDILNPEVFGQLKVTIDGETGELKSAEVLK